MEIECIGSMRKNELVSFIAGIGVVALAIWIVAFSVISTNAVK
jgi:hypothetical protein